MIELEGKIDILRKMMLEEQRRITDQELIASTEHVQKQLDKRKSELQALQVQYLTHRLEIADKKNKEQISLEREHARQAERSAKESCLQDLIDHIEHALSAYAQSDAYRIALQKDIEAVLDKDETQIVQVVPRDVDFVRAFAPKTTIVEAMPTYALGGFLVVNAARTTRDNHSLRAKLDQKRYAIGRTLYRLLEEGDEGHA